MFERYTVKSIKAIMLAQEESRRLGHNFVGTEQLLLGIIGEGTGIGAKVVRSMGVTLQTARVEVERITGRGAGFVAVEIPFTPRAKNVLNIALAESHQLGHNYIGTEHLLLGLIAEGEGVATRVLERLDVDLTKVRPQVIRMLGETVEFANDRSDSEADDRWKVDDLFEDNDFSVEPSRACNRDRYERRDPLDTAETLIMLRSILHSTIAIVQSLHELKAEIVTLNERVAKIEDKL
jgi:ATP-dependent Clp protease ATP-binding subunit ClpC